MPGPQPVWIGRDLSALADMASVVARVGAGQPRPLPDASEFQQPWVADARPSAVLVPLVEVRGAVSVVLTRRAEHLRNHAGEISFPGGRMEDGESAWDAALREAREEISLPPENVRRIGQLPPLTTFVSNSHITPVVGHVDGAPDLVPDEAEVARVVTVPLADFVRPDTHSSETWRTPRGEFHIHFFHLEDETVWGATARVIHSLIDVVTREP